MGWQYDDASDHEGYLVGCASVGKGLRFRELTRDDSAEVDTVHSACECGWRSPLIRVGGAPVVVDRGYVYAPKWLDDKGYRAWLDHVALVVLRRDGHTDANAVLAFLLALRRASLCACGHSYASHARPTGAPPLYELDFTQAIHVACTTPACACGTFRPAPDFWQW